MWAFNHVGSAKAEWDFHNAMLGVKAQALGLKKKSERKSPTRKANAAAK
jgi:hypothetical protein